MSRRPPSATTEHVDVLIVGAGLSGTPTATTSAFRPTMIPPSPSASSSTSRPVYGAIDDGVMRFSGRHSGDEVVRRSA